MTTIRMIRAPGTYSAQTIGGVAYTGSTYIDVPDFIAVQMTDGWTRLGVVGTTSERLEMPVRNLTYIDTTLNKVVIASPPTANQMAAGVGLVWIDPITGDAV